MNTNDPFAPPPAADGVSASDLNGSLLLIHPIAFEENVPTAYGASNAIRCTIAVLDGEQAGDRHEDVLLFGRVLVNSLRNALNAGTKMVLGRMGQGAAKPGQNPPWKLYDPSEQDMEAARAFLASRSAGTARTAQPTQAPPTPTPTPTPAPPQPAGWAPYASEPPTPTRDRATDPFTPASGAQDTTEYPF